MENSGIRGVKVAVIIPTFNRADMIRDAITSAMTQSIENLRIIVVDDGSIDGTEGVCAELVHKASGKIAYIKQENAGCSAARNTGLDRVEGWADFICFLDSDDRFLPGKLEREVNVLQKSPEAGFTYSDAVIFCEESGIESISKVAAAGRPECFALEHFLTTEAKCSALLYRARAIQGARFRQDLRYNEDSDFLQRVAMKVNSLYVDQPGSWIRWHPGSKSRNSKEILRAVWRCSNDFLKDFPEFHRKNAAPINARLKQLKNQLGAEYLLDGDWALSRQTSDDWRLKLLARLRINWPLHQYRAFRRLLRAVIRG